jgi:hypothetical protein
MGRPRKKAVGLGDTVESILAATHVDKMAKWLLGDDCGCQERKKKLNELFPYRKPECLEEPEHRFLKEWFEKNTDVVKPSEQATMLKIHSRIFKVRNEPTSCVPCLLDKVNQLRTVYNEYLPKDEI